VPRRQRLQNGPPAHEPGRAVHRPLYHGARADPENPDTRVASYRVANRSNRRPSLPPAGRPPTGANSCRCTTTATTSRRRLTSCLRSTSTRC